MNFMSVIPTGYTTKRANNHIATNEFQIKMHLNQTFHFFQTLQFSIKQIFILLAVGFSICLAKPRHLVLRQGLICSFPRKKNCARWTVQSVTILGLLQTTKAETCYHIFKLLLKFLTLHNACLRFRQRTIQRRRTTTSQCAFGRIISHWCLCGCWLRLCGWHLA